jgi:hypothetical protein
MKRFLSSKIPAITGIIIMILSPCVKIMAQNVVATKPATLEIYAMQTDGTQVVMTSDALMVSYDGLNMTGEIDFSTFQTESPVFQNLLDSALLDRITFSGLIPQGNFAFQDHVDEQFVVETQLHFGDQQAKIILEFMVSNRKTSLANTFDITATGGISLRDDLGILRGTGLDDRISFRFLQNVITRSY